MRQWFAVAGLLALGCPSDDTGDEGANPTSGPSTSGSTGGTAAETGEAQTGSSGSSDTGNATTDDPMSTGDTTAGSGESGGTTEGPVAEKKDCSLEVIDPTTDPATVMDAGLEAGQIPQIIGEALLRNCGCHYTDNAEGYTDYISNAAPMSTLADFHADFAGTFPANFDDQPTWVATEVRVIFNQPLPMPPNECGVEGEPGNMSMDDFVLFAQWFQAGAPDGASFP